MKINNNEKIMIPLPKKLYLTKPINSNSFSTQSIPKTELESQNVPFKDKQNNNNENFKTQETGIMEKIIKLNLNKNNNDPYLKSLSSPVENKTIKLFKNINIEKSLKTLSSDTSLRKIRPESINYRNFHLNLHNINNTFTNLYDTNNIVSISSYNSLNKSSQSKKNIFSFSKEFNNLGYNINHNSRFLRRFSGSVNSSPKYLRNKFFLNNDDIINKNNNVNNKEKLKKFELNSSFDNNIERKEINKLNKNPPIYSNFMNLMENKININNENNIGNNYFENDLEKVYLLENKFKDILSKIIASQPAYNECFEFLVYYFNESLYNKIILLFQNNDNRRILTYIIKIELLCICLCYNVSYDKGFYKSIILLKSIFEKIYNNYLILIKLILHKTTIKNENYILYETLFNLINKNVNIDLSKTNFEENNIIELLKQNINIISNYYKLIIDDLYLSYYQPQNNLYKFPSSIYGNTEEKLKYLKEIISSFFFDAFLYNDNYSIEEINQFFNLFLFKITEPNGSYFLSYNLQNSEKMNDNNIELKKNNNVASLYYLPKINPKYQYSLVLDLDETLIYLKRDLSLKSKRRIMILRPYLHEFLKKMKTLYELILFSYGTPEYVDPIVNIIEKKEKYFEHRLYRQHTNLIGKNYIKDLSKLGRDLKKVIIVDNMPQAFRLQKNNGICIKAFYGDVVADRDTLKILSVILEKIRFDAEKSNDIRISLRKEKQIIITKISSNQDL